MCMPWFPSDGKTLCLLLTLAITLVCTSESHGTVTGSIPATPFQGQHTFTIARLVSPVVFSTSLRAVY
jgi:hypothetical protein